MRKITKWLIVVLSSILIVILVFGVYSYFEQKSLLEEEYRDVRFRGLFSSSCSWNQPFQFQYEGNKNSGGPMQMVYDVTVCQDFVIDEAEVFVWESMKNWIY